MKRDLEKDLIEINAAIKSNEERDNIFTMSVLQRAHLRIVTAQELLVKAAEEIENLYGHETEFSKKIKDFIE